MCRNDVKIEKQSAWIAKKTSLKSTEVSIEKFKALCWVVLRGVFKTQLSIDDGAFLRKQLAAFDC